MSAEKGHFLALLMQTDCLPDFFVYTSCSSFKIGIVGEYLIRAFPRIIHSTNTEYLLYARYCPFKKSGLW